MTTALGAAAGLLADRVLGEPPAAIHPVAWFGRTVGWLERRCWRDRYDTGLAFAAVGVGAATAVGCGLRRSIGAGPATALAATLALAGRMLDDEALAVARLLEVGDIGGARERVRSLVGRDTAELDMAGIARAVVESVAENTIDAVVAPAIWAAAGGAPAVLAHRAVNTLDAMVGHRSARYRRFGWASARLDDVANAVPAWVGVGLVGAIVAGRRPDRIPLLSRAALVDARHHPSPNGGVIEGAFAAALGLRLGGTSSYGGASEDRGALGVGRPPVASDIVRAVRLRRSITTMLAAALAGGAVVNRRRWRSAPAA